MQGVLRGNPCPSLLCQIVVEMVLIALYRKRQVKRMYWLSEEEQPTWVMTNHQAKEVFVPIQVLHLLF